MVTHLLYPFTWSWVSFVCKLSSTHTEIYSIYCFSVPRHVHGRSPPSVSLFIGTTSQNGTAPVPLTMSLPDPKVKQTAHLQSEWTVCRDSSRGQEIMEPGRLAPRHQHQRQTEEIRRWGRKWTLSGNMELPLVWNSPEGGWKAKRAATPCWSAQPGRQTEVRRTAEENVGLRTSMWNKRFSWQLQINVT